MAKIVVLFGDYNNNEQVQFKRNALEYQDYFISLHKQTFSLKKISVIISLLVYPPQQFYFNCLLFFF